MIVCKTLKSKSQLLLYSQNMHLGLPWGQLLLYKRNVSCRYIFLYRVIHMPNNQIWINDHAFTSPYCLLTIGNSWIPRYQLHCYLCSTFLVSNSSLLSWLIPAAASVFSDINLYVSNLQLQDKWGVIVMLVNKNFINIILEHEFRKAFGELNKKELKEPLFPS